MLTERFKNVTSLEIKFVINLLNNKAIILLNLAEYRLILADSGAPNDNFRKNICSEDEDEDLLACLS